MQNEKCEKSKTLWSHVEDILIEEIHQATPGCNQLTAEEELVERLGVSRATVRGSLQALAKKGYVTRRHGKGNFAHPSALNMKHRVDLTADFIALLSTQEDQAVCRCLRCGYTRASKAMRDRFPTPFDTVFEQCWLYLLREKPLILCHVETPAGLLLRPSELGDSARTLAQWLSEHCGKDLAYYATTMGCRPNADAAWSFHLPEEQVLLNWQQVVYDIYDMPVSFCDLYFHPEDVNLSLALHF